MELKGLNNNDHGFRKWLDDKNWDGGVKEGYRTTYYVTDSGNTICTVVYNLQNLTYRVFAGEV